LSLIKILGRHQTQVHQRKRVSLLRRCPFVLDLARQYLDALSIGGLAEVEVYACGPHPMLEAVAVLAKEYALPCQVSLEEYMAETALLSQE
jgi:NAD(P)H-flavin reductase